MGVEAMEDMSEEDAEVAAAAAADAAMARLSEARKDGLRGAGHDVIGWEEEATEEAMEMTAVAVTLRQFPSEWEAFVDLDDGRGFQLCGTWDMRPPSKAVDTVVMDHILRTVMD
ncbi:unnamed protein product [Discosporangium mesarthrocarpum]